MDQDVIVFTRHGCSPCEATKTFLSQNAIAFTEYNVEDDAAALARFSVLGYQLVPVVLIKDDVIWPWGEGEFPESLQQTLKETNLLG